MLSAKVPCVSSAPSALPVRTHSNIRDRSRGKSRVEIASVSGVDTPLPTSKSLDPSMRRSAAVRQLEFLVSSSAVIYLLSMDYAHACAQLIASTFVVPRYVELP